MNAAYSPPRPPWPPRRSGAKPPARLTPLKFTLDFPHHRPDIALLSGAGQGYYRDEGLDVTIDTGAGSVASITRIASGVYQLGLGDISSLVEFNAEPGTPLVQAVYQYYNRAPFAIIGRKGPRHHLATSKSLEGKKIGAAGVESTRWAWPMVAKSCAPARHRSTGSPPTSAPATTWWCGDVDGATLPRLSDVPVRTHEARRALGAEVFRRKWRQPVWQRHPGQQRTRLRRTPGGGRLFLRPATARLWRPCQPAAAIAATRQPASPSSMKRWSWNAGASPRSTLARRHAEPGLSDIRKLWLEQQGGRRGRVLWPQVKPSADGLFNLSMLPPRGERMRKA